MTDLLICPPTTGESTPKDLPSAGSFSTPAIHAPHTHGSSAGVDPSHDLPADQTLSDAQVSTVGGHPLGTDHCICDDHYKAAGADLLHPGHSGLDAHPVPAGVDPSQPDPTTDDSTPKDAPSGPADPSSRPPIHVTSSKGTAAGGTSYPVLALYADALDDMERTRIANENRARSLEQMGFDAAEMQALLSVIEALAAVEHQTELQLNRALRKHPLGPWVKATKGIGEKQGARLIAAIGDPYWNDLHDRHRTVSELWAYCGYHVLHPGQADTDTQYRSAGVDPSSNPGKASCDPQDHRAGVAPSRTKGQRANWSNVAKMRAYLCAEAAVKAGVRKLDGADDSDRYDVAHREAISPLGQKYLDGRAKYAASVHGADCRRCGPKGKPALACSPLSEGHKHARALRLVAKEILRQLWTEAKAITEGER